MKKLKLKNLKVLKLSADEKKVVKGGTRPPDNSGIPCNDMSSPYISWCNGCSN